MDIENYEKYNFGTDPYADKKSKGALVVTKKTPHGIEVVKVMRWYDKNQWFQKLRVKFYLWRMMKLYKNVIIEKEIK